MNIVRDSGVVVGVPMDDGNVMQMVMDCPGTGVRCVFGYLNGLRKMRSASILVGSAIVRTVGFRKMGHICSKHRNTYMIQYMLCTLCRKKSVTYSNHFCKQHDVHVHRGHACHGYDDRALGGEGDGF
jgi:hypothetical protein